MNAFVLFIPPMRNLQAVTIIFALAALISCAANPAPPAFQEAAAPDTLKEASDTEGWWLSLNDAALNKQVALARADAFSVLQARASLQESEALKRGTAAQFWPSLNVFAQNTLQGNDRTITEDSRSAVGLDLSWQIDVFGQVRQTVSAASARVMASQALLRDAERLVTGDVVATYLGISGLSAELALVEASEGRLADALSKVQRLSQAGYATDLDAVRSQAQLLDVQARKSELIAQRRGLENRLAQLTVSPARTVGAGQLFDFDTQIVLPTDLPDVDAFTDARPDVRAAWSELEARAAETAAAKRRLLPDLSLSASIFAGEDGDAALLPTDLTSEIITRLAMPLLGRGRLLAQVDVADARLQQAEIAYRETVLRALLEIDTIGAEVNGLRAATDTRLRAMRAARTALSQSRRLFDAGEIAYLDVLVAEQALIDSERAAITARRDYLIAWARLRVAVSPT